MQETKEDINGSITKKLAAYEVCKRDRQTMYVSFALIVMPFLAGIAFVLQKWAGVGIVFISSIYAGLSIYNTSQELKRLELKYNLPASWFTKSHLRAQTNKPTEYKNSAQFHPPHSTGEKWQN